MKRWLSALLLCLCTLSATAFSQTREEPPLLDLTPAPLVILKNAKGDPLVVRCRQQSAETETKVSVGCGERALTLAQENSEVILSAGVVGAVLHHGLLSEREVAKIVEAGLKSKVGTDTAKAVARPLASRMSGFARTRGVGIASWIAIAVGGAIELIELTDAHFESPHSLATNSTDSHRTSVLARDTGVIFTIKAREESEAFPAGSALLE